MDTQQALLYSTGYIYMLAPYRIEAKCHMNLRYFPFDEQKCILKYGSWVHSMDLINITNMHKANGPGKIDLEELHPSEDFVLLNTKSERIVMKYPCCEEWYGHVEFTLGLKRSSGAYSAKLILPSVLTGFMILATFLLPPGSHEKITLCGIIFLAILLLFVYLQSLVPASGDTILGEYLAFALCIDFFATVLAVVSYNFHVRRSKQAKGTMIEGDDHDLKMQSQSTVSKVFCC